MTVNLTLAECPICHEAPVLAIFVRSDLHKDLVCRGCVGTSQPLLPNSPSVRTHGNTATTSANLARLEADMVAGIAPDRAGSVPRPVGRIP
jgi:hypothetical protein